MNEFAIKTARTLVNLEAKVHAHYAESLSKKLEGFLIICTSVLVNLVASQTVRFTNAKAK